MRDASMPKHHAADALLWLRHGPAIRRVGSKTDDATELTSPPPHTERLLGEGNPTQPVRRTSLGQEHEHVAPDEPS